MEPSSNSNNESLDQSKSNFSCVFCLSPGDSDSDYDSCWIKSPLVTLRNISRYLQIPIPLPEVSSSSSWYICDKCSKLAVEFDDLYHLGEEIKLRLNWCIEKFHGVMTQSEEEDNGHSGDPGNLFRAAFKSRAKEITSVPRVALCKTELPENKTPLLLLNECPTADAMDLDAEAADNNIQIQSPDNTIGIQIKMECDVMEVKASHSDSESQKYSPKVSSKKLKCRYCRAEFQGGAVNKFLRLHMVQYHCDTFFPNCKLDFVTDPEFKKIVGELLFKDLICEPWECVYCKIKFKSRKGRKRIFFAFQIKRHLIDAHFEKMKERLRKIQNSPNISTKLMECNPNSIGEVCECGVCGEDNCKGLLAERSSKVPKKAHICPECGTVCRVPSELNAHMRVHTKEQPYECNQCDEKFPYKSNLTRHVVMVHDKKKYDCEYCGNGLSSKQALQNHQKQSCSSKRK